MWVEAPTVSEGDEANDSPSPELGERAAPQTPVIRDGQTGGEQRKLDLNSAALMGEEVTVSYMHKCLTGTAGLNNPLLLGTA